MPKTAFIYSADMARYDLYPSHPLRPERLRMTYELASEYGLFGGESRLVEPSPAEEGDILSFHEPEYVHVVKDLSAEIPVPHQAIFGFGPGDNPPFQGMYEASLLYTGASLKAADLVMRGEAERAFSISGGLHHAKPARASGFCIFNDPVIAVKRLMQEFDRIAYIDIDVHHCDGVQEAFYDTGRVLTISIHESGDYLFPGTGDVQEIGEGEGKGFTANIPLAPGTPDDVYTQAFREVVPPLIAAYDPQVIVAQLGADSHFQDPLAHLNVTSAGFIDVVGSIVDFGKRLVALGGGGYDISAVSRLWTLAYAYMTECELPDKIPPEFSSKYGLRRLRDSVAVESIISDSQRASVKDYADWKTRTAKELLFPLHGIGL